VGLLRKAVRRATPRPVKQVKRAVTHPVRTTVRAATPRPIRQAQRTVFNVTHPVNTLENAIVRSVIPAPRTGTRPKSGGGRSAPRPKSTPNRRASSAPASASAGARGARQPQPTPKRRASTAPAPSSSANSRSAAFERAATAERIQDREASLFAQHVGESPGPATFPVPPLRIPAPWGFRREKASRISLSVFEAELAPFGDPPAAPTKAAPDVVATAESLYAQAVAEVPRFRFARRRRLRELAVTEAHDLVRRETQRLAEERERQQVDLDRKDRLRQALRTSLEQMVAKWLVEQRAIAEADHTRAAARAEVWSRRLRANDPTTLREALGPDILGAHVRVGAVVDGIVELVVHFAELERLISAHEPAVTSNGRLTVKKRPVTRRNELYAAAVASELLRLSRLSFARAGHHRRPLPRSAAR